MYIDVSGPAFDRSGMDRWRRFQNRNIVSGRQIRAARMLAGLAQAVAEHIGVSRFRPEHVTAGAVNANRPLGYADAERLGMRIRSDLIRSYKGKPP